MAEVDEQREGVPGSPTGLEKSLEGSRWAQQRAPRRV